jgi:hypothetical protein
MQETRVAKKDFITSMAQESEAYRDLERIELLLEDPQGDLSVVPVQPLYMATLNCPAERLGELLPRLSSEQRQLCLDIDLWDKDELDIEGFSRWLSAYTSCTEDAVRLEFMKSSELILFLKAKFHIWTFDAEDPQYPESDNYFLTEDNQLLFEYEADFPFVDEVQSLIKDLYTFEGVENAYSFLFKLVADSFLVQQEEEYQLKKERLRDIGVVDYYEALELLQPYASRELMDASIRRKGRETGVIDAFSQNQVLPEKALAPYRDRLARFAEEMDKITEEKRAKFVQFSFLRLVNSTTVASGSLKEGSMALVRAQGRARALLELGLEYLVHVSLP